MTPPFFVLNSGTLDVCDTAEDLADRYPRGELASVNAIVCDSTGKAIWISRAADGGWVNAAAEPQSPNPELVRRVLRGYLEKNGMSSQEVDTLPLSNLIAKAHPVDPLPEQQIMGVIFWKIFLLAFMAICIAITLLINWLRAVR